MPSIRIPTPLRKITNNQENLLIEGNCVGECIMMLCSSYPELSERLLDSDGSIRRFINIFVNDEDIKFLQDLQTPVKSNDEISIIPAIAGG